MRILLLLTIAVLFNGCAILDPHNIVGRISVPETVSSVPVPELNANAWKREAFERV